MKRKVIYLACAFLILSISSVEPVQSGVQNRQRGRKYKKKSDGPIAKPSQPDLSLKTDLSFNADMSICYNHAPAVRITRTGNPFTNSFVLSLKVYRGSTVVESMSQTIWPFAGTGETFYFETQTQLYRTDSSEQLSCRFTIDVQNQISERSENNNVLNKSAPIVGHAHE